MYGLLKSDNIWLRYNYLYWKSGVWGCKNIKIQLKEKIAFKVVQMMCLAMHITVQKLSYDICMVGNLQNIFI